MKFSSEVVHRFIDVVEVDGERFEVKEVTDVLDWLGNRIGDCHISQPLREYLLAEGIMKKHDWGGFSAGPNFNTFHTQFHAELRKFEGER